MACEAQAPEKKIGMEEIENTRQKLKMYLVKDTELASYISINEVGVEIYASPEDRQARKVEFSLAWSDLDFFKEILARNPSAAFDWYSTGHKPELKDSSETLSNQLGPLAGIKIALDPGHLAGDFATARMEGKYIEMFYQGKKVRFFESELAWYTAKILGNKLEALGAEVLLTRNQFDHSAFDKSYDTWFKEFVAEKSAKAGAPRNFNKSIIFFREFRKPELKERVRKINAFNPDLTLIIHYNVDANNTGWKRTTNKNNSMAFVGGSFMKGELEEVEARFHLLRLLLTTDFEASIEFSKSILEALEEKLAIQAIPQINEQFFLKDRCIFTGELGVYARNLTLARRLHGAICYAEPLYQDNVQEVGYLSQRDYFFEGRHIPKRLLEVADAYLAGIRKYLNK